MLLLALAVQAATAATPLPAVPERMSILVPVPDERCTRHQGDDIVVCANALPSQTLPLPQEAVSDRPVPINGYLTGRGALNAEGTPCAARSGGCQTGVDVVGPGVALVRGIQKLISPDSCCENPGESTSAGQLASDVAGGVKKLFRGKPDKSNRVAIRLDDTPPATSRVLP
ncbi:hypothetical protein SAMN05216382_1627 [Sphingomonas palmae]|uniref:Uncharacterized protein n=1 Tax=Sphingomonas palmae TaxID=1855283 RepID=A0A1H7NL77_9SPHN|nr:hypothetical protein [Sphingomonas palmae]SEL24312.1 hypothetical protein SAMN05216382_1627 [Sphingomonas palmae]